MDLIALPTVTEPLISHAAVHLSKTSRLGYSGVSEGMLIDVEIVMEFAREVYQRWLNEHTYKLGDVVIFDKKSVSC